MGESFDTCGNLLIPGIIESVLRCELNRVILALAASIVRAILMFQFQKEDEKLAGKKGADVVSNRLTFVTHSVFYSLVLRRQLV